MSQETFQITLTADEFTNLSAKLKSMNLGADYLQRGTLPQMAGVVLSYAVQQLTDGSSTVSFTVLKKPWIVGIGMIQAKVEQFVKEA